MKRDECACKTDSGEAWTDQMAVVDPEFIRVRGVIEIYSILKYVFIFDEAVRYYLYEYAAQELEGGGI